LAALFPASALAHDGHFAQSGDLGEALTVWSPDPGAIVLIAVVVGLYAWAYRRLRVVAPGFHFPRWHAVAFGSGAALLLVSLVSPIDTYSDDLFWVHMVQHMVIVMLVAPLLLLGAPVTLALRVSSARVRREYLIPLLQSRFAQVMTYPAVAVLLFVASVWVWHLPTFYDAAIGSEVLHFLEHGSFLGGALLVWWLIIGVDATHLRPGYVGRVAVVVVALMQNIALALILTSTGDPIYETYEALALVREWGPSAIDDQRLGAGVMWVPGAMMFGLALLVVFYFWAEHEGFEGRRGDMLRDLEARKSPPPVD
jgi:cytochrome c oxidase assembly factor CtaG